MGVVAHRLQHLDASDARVDGAVGAARPLPGGVEEPELQGLDAEALGQLVHDRLSSEGGVGCAGRPVGVGLGLVDGDVEAVDDDVGDVVGGEDGHGARADRGAGEGAGLVGEVRLGRR